jgi:hypothetical protein
MIAVGLSLALYFFLRPGEPPKHGSTNNGIRSVVDEPNNGFARSAQDVGQRAEPPLANK